MTDQRPMAYRTEFRGRIRADATTIPVIAGGGFHPDARKLIGGQEYVRCTGVGTDQFRCHMDLERVIADRPRSGHVTSMG